MQELKKVVFLGSKPIGSLCLAYLLEHKEALAIQVIAVGTQDRKEFSEQNPIKDMATEHSIPLLEHPDDIPECDIIYSVQYHKILRQHHIDKAQQIAVNLHLAPLPDYRGCNQFSFAIFNGAKEFGVTIHAIDTGVDSGPILFEDRFAMPPDVWVKELYEQSVARGYELFKTTLTNLLQENYALQPQGALVPIRGVQEYKRKDIEWIKKIDLSENANKTMQRIRATYMPGFAPPYFQIGDKKVNLTVADY